MTTAMVFPTGQVKVVGNICKHWQVLLEVHSMEHLFQPAGMVLSTAVVMRTKVVSLLYLQVFLDQDHTHVQV